MKVKSVHEYRENKAKMAMGWKPSDFVNSYAPVHLSMYM